MAHLMLLLCFVVSLNLLRSEVSSSPCPDDFTYHEKSGKCFLIESDAEPMSQMSARLKCAGRGAFLASIHSSDENNAIKDLLTSKGVTIAYIGLQSREYDVADRYWSDGSAQDYENWMSGKPDNGELADDGCVVIVSDDGKWDDWSCSANEETGPQAAVCQFTEKDSDITGKDSKCPEGFEHLPETDNCYKIVVQQTAMSQSEAQEECKKYGAHLVSIGSEIENNFISDLAMRNPFSAMRVYIGLESDPGTDASKRHWIDGDPLEFFKWETTKPDNEPYGENACVVMVPERGGVWDDWVCSNPCKKCQKWAVYGAACHID